MVCGPDHGDIKEAAARSLLTIPVSDAMLRVIACFLPVPHKVGIVPVAPAFAGTLELEEADSGSHSGGLRLPTGRMWESSDCQCGPGTTYTVTTAPSPDLPPTALAP